MVVGVGSDIPDRTQPWRFRKKFNVRRPFALYVGRIDENKGCPGAVRALRALRRRCIRDGLDLILLGSSVIDVPKHPRIRHLGFLPDEDKFDALAAADLLIMPSPFREPLDGRARSVGAWQARAGQRPVRRAARPVHSQQRRAVLRHVRGVRRGDVRARSASGPLGAILGRKAASSSARHYAWPVIERKYLDMFDRLSREPAAGRSSRCPACSRAGAADVPAGARDRATRPRPGRCCAMTRRPRVHQILATLGYGDAIGNEVLGIRRALRGAGFDSEIIVETADPRLEDLTVDYRDMVDASRPDDLLIHHFSLGSRASRTAFALPSRMVLVYHNITPPEYFLGVHDQLVRQCYHGRRELLPYRSRCDLALGDSEFNRRGTGVAGLPAHGGAARRPGLHASRRRARRACHRRATTTTWTNILFVGRLIPNKRPDDVIRFFHAYKSALQPAGAADARRVARRLRVVSRAAARAHRARSASTTSTSSARSPTRS